MEWEQGGIAADGKNIITESRPFTPDAHTKYLDRRRPSGECAKMKASLQSKDEAAGSPGRPLAGARAWVVSDGKAGHEAMCRGVADALGVAVEWKHVAPRGIWKALSPWAPVAPGERFAASGTPFAPPWPEIALAAGRTTTPYIRALKKRAGADIYTVILMDPRTGLRGADLFWVPEHDGRGGANVLTTLVAPHPFSPARLASIQTEGDARLELLPSPRIAVLIGGPNGRFHYPPPVIERLAACVRSLADLGAGLMLTASRRTPPSLVAALEAATGGTGTLFWNGEGANPYPKFLAYADAFLITADSVNMAGEAAATGRPIYIFEPEGGAAKFDAFHGALRARGISRRAPGQFTSIETWDYAPLHAAETIAAEIGRRWQAARSGGV